MANMKMSDTDNPASITFWIGIGSFVLGIVSILITLYTAFNSKPSVLWLTVSGWIATTIVAAVAGFLGHKIVRLLSVYVGKNDDLIREISILKNDNSRMIMLSEYVASKATRATARRRREPTEGDTDGD